MNKNYESNKSSFNKLCDIQDLLKKESSLRLLCK